MNVRISVVAVLNVALGLASLAVASPAFAARKGAVSLIVPIAGSSTGALGTVWRSDLSIINHRNVEQTVTLSFNESNVFSYGAETETQVTLPPHSTTTYPDAVDTLFHLSSFGVIYINADFYSAFDPAAELDATYRIWTAQPGGKGTSSQSSSAVDMAALPPGGETQVAIGVRLDAHFRCNVGITSVDYYDHLFQVTATSPAGSVTMTVTVVGYSTNQVPLPQAELGYVTVTVQPLGPAPAQWTAYATSVDNESGDSWLQSTGAL